MWPIKYSAILESKVNFDETYTKMSKCENSVFPYYFHSIINFQHGGRKTQMLLKCLFSVYSLRQLHPKESAFSWQMLTKLTKFVRNCQHAILWHNHQNWNLSFRNFLIKYEPRIKDQELHDKEQKVYTNFLYFYILKELSPKLFS